MNRRMDLFLRHTHRDMEGMETVEESRHAGTLRQEADALVLRYTDASDEQDGDAEVTLRLTEAEMSYRRAGEFSVASTYREGTDCDIRYDTPYGALAMCTHTEWLRWSFDGRQGQVSLHFRLSAGEERLSETRLELAFAVRDDDV